MKQKFKKLNAFTLAEGGHSPLLCGDAGTQGSPHLVKGGFTLAEVLITLGVIGVVAAMTMPTLIANHREKQTVAQLKKFMSVFDQAIKLISVTEGDIADWQYETETPALEFYEKIKPNLKLIRDCGITSYCICPNCKNNSLQYDYGDGTITVNFNNTSNFSSGILADGSTFWIEILSKDCAFEAGESKALKHVCGVIDYDINGPEKGPNSMGQDFFYFWITRYGVIPRGSSLDTNAPIETSCLKDGKKHGCAAWVVYKENMDYLKKDIAW